MTERTRKIQKDSRDIVLAIELSNPSASPEAHAAALFAGGGKDATLIGSMPMPPGVRSSDGIMVLIERLCTSCEVSPGDISRIIVSVGPGGYTALRISTSTAKVLAATLGCGLVAVPSARVAAAAIDPTHLPALIALASKNERAHCSRVETDGSIEEIGVIDADQIEALDIRTLVGDAHLPATFSACASRLGIEICPIVLDARWCLIAAEAIEPIDPIELSPIYAREPDAVTQWRKRGAE